MTNSLESIRSEIRRFESVHPSIYSIYELLESLENSTVSNLIREHVVSIEDSFVNSQEWTLNRDVKEIRIGVVGDINSEKSCLVHRYITGTFLEDDSPDGGRFKKELVINSKPYLLLIRDEADIEQFDNLCSWMHCLIVVSNCHTTNSFASSIQTNVPVLLAAICTNGNEFLGDFLQLQHAGVCRITHWSREEIDTVFSQAAQLAVNYMHSSPVNNVTVLDKPLVPGMTTPGNNRKFRRRSNIFTSSAKNVGVGRTIPIKQGLMFKKTDKSKRWKKKYVILVTDELIYYDSINDYMENSSGKGIKLINTCVKPLTGSSGTGRLGFSLTTIEKKIYEFELENGEDVASWLNVLQEVLMSLIQRSGNGTSNIDKVILDRIKNMPGNDACADCGGSNPMWTCINHGNMVCIRCSGIHRQLGTHISRIRSLQLDEFSSDQLNLLLLVGNQTFNNVYGGICPSPDNLKEFIQDKYVLRKYVRPTNVKELKDALRSGNAEGVVRYVANQLPFSKEIDSSPFAMIQLFALPSNVTTTRLTTAPIPNSPSGYHC